MSYAAQHLEETVQIVAGLDSAAMERMAVALAELRERGGRLFLLGVGGSAANCSHAVNDFRKLAGIEAYAPTDNVSELTARVNDEGWDTVFREWLRGQPADRQGHGFRVLRGRGQRREKRERRLDPRLGLRAEKGAAILGIVARDGGYTAQVADICVIVPTVNPKTSPPTPRPCKP